LSNPADVLNGPSATATSSPKFGYGHVLAEDNNVGICSHLLGDGRGNGLVHSHFRHQGSLRLPDYTGRRKRIQSTPNVGA
jgi:hypothetical protein